MNAYQLMQNIKEAIRNEPGNYQPYEDWHVCLLELRKQEHDKVELLKENAALQSAISSVIRQALLVKNYSFVDKLDKLLFQTYLYSAKDSFNDFLIALEWYREPSQRFYTPRQSIIRPFVDALQALADDEMDELFLSCPPRIGKTTLIMFFALWIMGRDPERSNLYSSYSDGITKSFYSGLMEVIGDTFTYQYRKIFPFLEMPSRSNGFTNAADETIDLNRKKRYHSITCRSIDGTLNGSCDCDGILIADDIIGGIEQAQSRDRMEKAWSTVDNNLLTRAKSQAKILWIGTRWSVIDPAGKRQDLLMNDERFADRRFRIISIPALDENDESNFDYEYGVGYDTAYYHQRRASFERSGDMASWLAQYMQEPIERQGTVFDAKDMRYFNGVLPEEEPDRIFMFVDPAWGGGDFVASPVCVQYGNDIYVPGVVYSNEDKRITQPLLVQAAKKFNCHVMKVEANKMTQDYADGVNDCCGDYHITITTSPAQNNKAKEQRIFDQSPDIKERFIFLEDGKRPKEYSLFMQNVYSFKIQGGNKHDDAPDSLAGASAMAFKWSSNSIEVLRRPF